jgi:hypothetical protein
MLTGWSRGSLGRPPVLTSMRFNHDPVSAVNSCNVEMTRQRCTDPAGPVNTAGVELCTIQVVGPY